MSQFSDADEDDECQRQHQEKEEEEEVVELFPPLSKSKKSQVPVTKPAISGWAGIAKKGAQVEQPVAAPQGYAAALAAGVVPSTIGGGGKKEIEKEENVVVNDSSVACSSTTTTTTTTATSTTSKIVDLTSEETKRAELMVVDTAGLIAGATAHLEKKAVQLWTIPEVFEEVRDKQSRAWVDALPFQIGLREPSVAAFNCVARFAKQSGDFPSLSKVDLKVIALTYQFEAERNGIDHLRSEPAIDRENLKIRQEEKQPNNNNQEQVQEHEQEQEQEQQKIDDMNKNDDDDDDGWGMTADQKRREKKRLAREEKLRRRAQAEREEEERLAQRSFDGGWITPGNVDEVRKADAQAFYGVSDMSDVVDVACYTHDFTMQNVLIQIGLNVLAADGYLIKRVRYFALRCHACNNVERNTAKVFCSACGNSTLIKVGMRVHEDGSVSFGYPYYMPSKRGTKFKVRPPKTGRHGVGIILSEDDLKRQQQRMRGKKKDVDVFDLDYQFAEAAAKRSNAVRIGTGRRNPNEARRRINKRKKRRNAGF